MPGCVIGSRAVPAAAKTKSQIDCHTPPRMSGRRRPKRSMTYIPPNVQPKLTAPRMICVTNESLMPTDLNTVAPYCRDAASAKGGAERREGYARRRSSSRR